MGVLGPRQGYLPFGAGPRNCIGTGFAILEVVLVLATMLRDYEVAPGGKFAPKVDAQPVITLRPSSIHLAIRKRNNHGSHDV